MRFTEAQVKAEYGRFAPEHQNRPPLKRRYLNHAPAKFGGQKRKAGNSGNVGRRFRARQRSLIGPGMGKR